MKGFKLKWPDSVPREVNISETLVIVMTSVPLDLRCLDTKYRHKNRVSLLRADDFSKLQQIANQISFGGGARNIDDDENDVCYGVRRVSFKLGLN